MRVDLPPTLPEPAHHLLAVHGVPHGWPLRAQLGDGAVQGPALERDHVRPTSGASVSEPLLVVLCFAQRVQVRRAQQPQGR